MKKRNLIYLLITAITITVILLIILPVDKSDTPKVAVPQVQRENAVDKRVIVIDTKDTSKKLVYISKDSVKTIIFKKVVVDGKVTEKPDTTFFKHYIYTSTDSLNLDSLNSGNILVRDSSKFEPLGSLRKITGKKIYKLDSVYVADYITEQALLTDIFINCPRDSSLIKRKIEYKDIDRKTLERDSTLIDIGSGSIKFKFKKPYAIYDLDGKKSTTDDQVTISGEFELDDSLEFAFDIMNRNFKNIKLIYHIKETSKLSINSNITKKIDKKERIIGYNLFSFRQIIYGIPIWFTIKFEINAGITGEFSAHTTVGLEQVFDLRTGIEYIPDGSSEDKAEDADWNIIFEKDIKLDHKFTDLGGELNFRAYISPRLSLDIYGIGGPYAEGRLYGGIENKADVIGYSRKVTGGIEVLVGACVKLFFIDLWEVNKPILDESISFLNEFYAFPIVEITSPANSSAHVIGDKIEISAGVKEKSNELESVNFYINDALVTTDVSAPYEYIWDTSKYPAGQYSLKSVARNKYNLTGESSITVKLKEPPPVPSTVTTVPEPTTVIPPSPEMIFVKGGAFQMGQPDPNIGGTGYSKAEQPIHSVTVSDFYIGKTEVTQSQYQEIMGNNPSTTNPTIIGNNTSNLKVEFGIDNNNPVYFVNWYDILVYCNKRSISEKLTPCYSIRGATNPNSWGTIPTRSNSVWNEVICNFKANGYRLPSAAEWEYAAKGGSKSREYKFSGSNVIDEVAWYLLNSNGKTHKVGEKKANELGIYDMSGNACEWCWDWYSEESYISSLDNNPVGSAKGTYREIRGGGIDYDAVTSRINFRNFYLPEYGSNNFGFRVVRTK